MSDDCTHPDPSHYDVKVFESRADVTTITECSDCGGIVSSEHAVKIRPSEPGTGGRPLPRRRKR